MKALLYQPKLPDNGQVIAWVDPKCYTLHETVKEPALQLTVRPEGFEPTTLSLRGTCSAVELEAHDEQFCNRVQDSVPQGLLLDPIVRTTRCVQGHRPKPDSTNTLVDVEGVEPPTLAV